MGPRRYPFAFERGALGRGQHSGLRNDRLRRAVYFRFQKQARDTMGARTRCTRYPSLRKRHNAPIFGRARPNPEMEHQRTSKRRLLNRKRHHHQQDPSLAAHDRPAKPGKQVHQIPGQGAPRGHRRGQDQRGHAHAHDRARRAIRQMGAARERGQGAGPLPRANPAPTGDQAGQLAHDHAGRQSAPLLRILQALPHDHAPQPALLPGNLREGHDHQLRHHAVRARGANAGADRRAREPADGGQEARDRAQERPGQADAAQHRGQNSQQLVRHRGRHRRGAQGRDPHQRAAKLQAHEHGDQQEGRGVEDHRGADRRGQGGLPARRLPGLAFVLLHPGPRVHRPHVPVLAAVVHELIHHVG